MIARALGVRGLSTTVAFLKAASFALTACSRDPGDTGSWRREVLRVCHRCHEALAEAGGAGRIYLSTVGNFSVPGLRGADEDVFVFTPSPSSTGDNTSGTYEQAPFLDGSEYNLGRNDLSALDLP